APTSTARRAYRSRRSAAVTIAEPTRSGRPRAFPTARPGQRGSVPPVLASAITGLGKTVLLLVAITFILWSLYTALVVPKRYPGFPRRLDLYIVLSAVLFLAQMTAVVWVTSTQQVEHEEAGETHPA